jgi:hydroxypyruvate isomerase
MPRFAANLSFMYQEYDFLGRFAAAAKDGFKGIEYLFPYEHTAAELAKRLKDRDLTQVLFNAPPGNWSRGERGIASLPERENEFRQGIETALLYADILGNKLVHVMAGLLDPQCGRSRHRDIFLDNLAYAARQAAAQGVCLVIEPINTRDMPGYLLNYQHEAHQICRDVGADNLKVQADLYHCQIVEGDLTRMLRQFIGGIGHIQIAGVPERHEPDTGEVNYEYLLNLIDSLGYSGWVGCEYWPKASTSGGLGWQEHWQELKMPGANNYPSKC